MFVPRLRILGLCTCYHHRDLRQDNMFGKTAYNPYFDL